MPSRNVLKENIPETFYHVYARGASRREIFLDQSGYLFFLSLFARYLSRDQQAAPWGSYPHLRGSIELVTYCLMPNHFHLLIYQIDSDAMMSLMKSIMTSYSRYFNHKYDRSGSLFESRYKAARIASNTHLRHISRYIHLNPRYWRRYPYSSLRYYVGQPSPDWLQINRIAELFSSSAEYREFVEDYEANKIAIDEIKQSLANQ